MIRDIHAIYTGNFEKLLVSIYTCAQYSNYIYEKIAIIQQHQLTVDELNTLNSITPVVALSTGQESEKYFNSATNLTDITDKVFERPDSSVKVEQTINNSNNRVAVVVYVYYYDYWSEIFNHIKLLSSITSVDVYVYLCDNNSPDIAKKIYTYSNVKNINIILNWVSNKGRDVRSFLKFIIDGNYNKYKFIAKVHTKKTTYLDKNWRGNFLDELLKPESAKRYWKTLGSQELTSVNKYSIHEKYVSTNPNFRFMSSIIKMYNKKLSVGHTYKFTAGTMFWCTGDYCSRIHEKLQAKYLNEFESEPIQNDGSLAHAWERAFHII